MLPHLCFNCLQIAFHTVSALRFLHSMAATTAGPVAKHCLTSMLNPSLDNFCASPMIDNIALHSANHDQALHPE